VEPARRPPGAAQAAGGAGVSYLDLDESARAAFLARQLAARDPMRKDRAGNGPTYLEMTPAERRALLARQQERRWRDIAGPPA